MKALIVAWGITILSLAGLATWLQLSYEPPDPTAIDLDDHDDPVTGNTAEDNTAPGVDDNTGVETGVTRFGNDGAMADANTGIPDTGADSISDIVTGGTVAPVTITGPDNTLIEDGAYGGLPLIWNQRQPWQVYSRPFDRPGDRPRIAIIITGMGLSQATTRHAIDSLPPEVSLALSPYGQDLSAWAREIRLGGHESLMMLPMEPIDYPVNDPGPHTLLTNLSPVENVDRLHFVLARAQGYVGVINDMGSKFTADPDAIRPIMQDLQRRGVVFVDARTTRMSLAATSAREFGVHRAVTDRFIDNDISAAQIDRYLRELENVALRTGTAVGIGRPYPLTINQVVAWAATLDAKGIDLAPVSAVADRQDVR